MDHSGKVARQRNHQHLEADSSLIQVVCCDWGKGLRKTTIFVFLCNKTPSNHRYLDSLHTREPNGDKFIAMATTVTAITCFSE